MSTVRSLGLSALLALFALMLSSTGLLLSPTPASAMCVWHDTYMDDEGRNTADVMCDDVDECLEYANTIIDSTGGMIEIVSCYEGDVSASEETPDPLGEIPEIEGPVVGYEYEVEPSCYADSCDGLDPAATSCLDDAVTIYSREAVVNGTSYGHAEMRYSESCHANWVRFTPWGGLRTIVHHSTAEELVGGRPYIWRKGVENSLQGPAGDAIGVTLLEQSVWTAMVPADGQTCWSVEVYWYGGGAGESDVTEAVDGSAVDRKPDVDTSFAEDVGTWEGGCVE